MVKITLAAKSFNTWVYTLALAFTLGISFLSPHVIAQDGTTTDAPASSPIEEPGPSCNGGDSTCDTDSTTPTQGNLPDSGVGNPINLMTGNKHQSEIDFDIPGSMLTLKRSYNSADSNSNRGLGQGWNHTFTASLLGTGNGSRQIIGGDGRQIDFFPDGVNDEGYPLFRAAQSNNGYLTFDEEHHRWYLQDGRILSFNGSFLVNIDWPDQRELKLYYRYRRLHSVTDETGRVMRFNYTAGEANTLHSYEATPFSSVEGYLASVTLPDGSEIGYDYDGKRNLTRVRLPDGTSRQYHYEDDIWPNRLTGLTDRTGVRYASWSYDDQGRAISSEHAAGVEKVTLQYPDIKAVDQGEIVETLITNSLGEQSVYSWQKNTNLNQELLLSSRGTGCATCPETGYSYLYDSVGRLTNVITTGLGSSPVSGELSYSYDSFGRLSLVNRTDNNGKDHLIERYEYQGTSLLPSAVVTRSVNPDGESSDTYVRDERGRIITLNKHGYTPVLTDSAKAVTIIAGIPVFFEPTLAITHFNYNDEGHLISVNGPREDVDDSVKLNWDSNGYLEHITTPAGSMLNVLDRNSFGLITSYKSGLLGKEPVHVTYNQSHLVTSLIHRNRGTYLSYDAQDRLIKAIRPSGEEINFEYDTAGRLIYSEDSNGQSVVSEHDDESRTIEESRRTGAGEIIESLSMLYGAQGRVEGYIRESNAAGNPSREQFEMYYDELNRPSQVFDINTGGQVSFSYSDSGLLNSWTNGEGFSEQQGHDAKDQIISYTDSRGNQTGYIKDDNERVIALINPDTGITQYQYDLAGNRIEKRDANGSVIQYRWDEANRLVEKQGVDNTTKYSYHKNNGRLLSTSNDDTSEYFLYDDHAQLIEHRREIDSHQFVTRYTYDDHGRIHKKTLPDGQVLVHHYHENSKRMDDLRAITRESLFGFVQETILAEIDTNTSDGTSGHLAHNGQYTQRQHTTDGRISSILYGSGPSVSYRYNSEGRITEIDSENLIRQFGYDRGQLSFAYEGDSVHTYSYDELGNRTHSAEVNNDGEILSANTYRYPEEGDGNRLLEEFDSLTGQSTSTNYDLIGAPLARHGIESVEYEYNEDGRPIRVLKNSQLIAEYAYNSFGERIRKTRHTSSGTRITYYLYDGHQLTAEIETADQTSRRNELSYRHTVFVEQQPLAYLIDQNVYSIDTDHLGTPIKLTDAAGDTSWQATYDVFGKATVEQASIQFRHRLPGQYFDEETETHYNYYRDYDPGTGRYLTSDPIGLDGGVNTYAYALNDPLGLTDALGLAPDDTQLTIDGVTKPVADTAYLDKLKFVLLEAGSAAGGEILAMVQDMVKPENLLNTALVAGAVLAVQGVPVVNVIVNGLLAAYTWWEFGSAGLAFLGALTDTAFTLVTATNLAELCNTARSLGQALADVGVAALDILDRGRSQRGNNDQTNANDINNAAVSCRRSSTGLRSAARSGPSCSIAPPSKTEEGFGYGRDGDAVIGPLWGRYEPTGNTTTDGYAVYENSGKFYVFKDGDKIQVDSPRAPTSNSAIGAAGELQVAQILDNTPGLTRVHGDIDTNKGVLDNAATIQGQQGIDAIYKDSNGNLVIVEVKASQNSTAGGFGDTNNGQQMSIDWLRKNLRELGYTRDEVTTIIAGINSDPKTTRLLKAEVTGVTPGGNGQGGTLKFYDVNTNGTTGASRGAETNP